LQWLPKPTGPECFKGRRAISNDDYKILDCGSMIGKKRLKIKLVRYVDCNPYYHIEVLDVPKT